MREADPLFGGCGPLWEPPLTVIKPTSNSTSKEPAKSNTAALTGIAGALIIAISMVCPWSTIGGVTRDGLDTANVLRALQASLPIPIGVVGVSWYMSGLTLIFIGFSSLTGSSRFRSVIAFCLYLMAALNWVTFVGVCRVTGVLKITWFGPTVASVGLVVLFVALIQKRQGLFWHTP